MNKRLVTAFLFLYVVASISCKKPDEPMPTVMDVDGNVYRIVTIGSQTWMAENLKVTHYRNGDPIENITDGSAWSSTGNGAYCYYENDETANKKNYGALYNWYAVNDVRNIAPEGWHIPTDAEWEQLTTYLGGADECAGKLKEKGTIHWKSPNTNATNGTGFTALPGGSRGGSAGTFFDIGRIGSWWTSTDAGIPGVWNRGMSYYYSSVFGDKYPKYYGFAVRCVKD